MTPRTKDMVLASLNDELRGLLMESVVISHKLGDWSKDGRLITQQIHRANDLFKRIVATAAQPDTWTEPLPEPVKPKPALNGAFSTAARKPNGS